MSVTNAQLICINRAACHVCFLRDAFMSRKIFLAGATGAIGKPNPMISNKHDTGATSLAADDLSHWRENSGPSRANPKLTCSLIGGLVIIALIALAGRRDTAPSIPHAHSHDATIHMAADTTTRASAQARPETIVRPVSCHSLPHVPGKSLTTAIVEFPPGAHQNTAIPDRLPLLSSRASSVRNLPEVPSGLTSRARHGLSRRCAPPLC